MTTDKTEKLIVSRYMIEGREDVDMYNKFVNKFTYIFESLDDSDLIKQMIFNQYKDEIKQVIYNYYQEQSIDMEDV